MGRYFSLFFIFFYYNFKEKFGTLKAIWDAGTLFSGVGGHLLSICCFKFRKDMGNGVPASLASQSCFFVG